jgi:hypothetical protein
VIRGACEGRGLLSYVSFVRVCLCVYAGVHVCMCMRVCICVRVYVCMCPFPLNIISLVRAWRSSFAYLLCRERYCESGKACVSWRESFRIRVREREHRVGPSRDDVNSVRRIRLRPSCDVKIRYRDARLRREVSKRW